MTWTLRPVRDARFESPLDCEGRLLAIGDHVEATPEMGAADGYGVGSGSRGTVVEVRPRLSCESGALSEPVPNGVRVELGPGLRTTSAAFLWRKVDVN